MAIESIHTALLSFSLIIHLILAGYMFFKKLNNSAAIYYFLFLLGLTVHIAGDLFFQLSFVSGIGLFWIRLYWIGFFFMALFFFYFTSVFPKTGKVFIQSEASKALLMVLPLGLSYMLLFSSDFIKNLNFLEQGINSVNYGSLYLVGVIYIGFFLGISLVKLYLDYRATSFGSEKRAILIIFFGLFVSAFLGIVGDTFFLKLLGFGNLKLSSVFMILPSLTMGYVLIKHKVFSINPASEEQTSKKSESTLVPGRSYFVQAKSNIHKKAFRMFESSVKNNMQGLIVSITDPLIIKQRYRLKLTPMLHITKSDKTSDNCVLQTEIGPLTNSITSFFNLAQNPIVLIDGLKELILENKLSEVKSFLNSIISSAKQKGAIVLFSISDEEKFTTVFSEILPKKELLKTIEKKLLARKLTKAAYFELAKETETEIIEKECELKIIAEELIDPEIKVNKLQRDELIVTKAIHLTKYKLAKHKISQEIGTEILNHFDKKLVKIEQLSIREQDNSSI